MLKSISHLYSPTNCFWNSTSWRLSLCSHQRRSNGGSEWFGFPLDSSDKGEEGLVSCCHSNCFVRFSFHTVFALCVCRFFSYMWYENVSFRLVSFTHRLVVSFHLVYIVGRPALREQLRPRPRTIVDRPQQRSARLARQRRSIAHGRGLALLSGVSNICRDVCVGSRFVQ